MNELLQLKKTIFNLGTKREYKLFQISDMHMSCVDENSTEIDKNDHERVLDGWGKMKYEFAENANEFCDERYDMDPCIMFKMLTDYAITIKADALILSGDIIDRITDSNVRFMSKFIKEFPIPVVYCPGNHDWISESGEHLNQYERIKPITKNPACNSFDFGEFEVVTVDNGNKQITDYQLDFLKAKLNSNKKILLVVHAPLNLGESGEELKNRLSPYFLLGVDGDCSNAYKFNSLVKENDDRIIAVLTGHIHAFHEGNITDNLKQYSTSSGLIGACREIIIK